MSPKRTPLHAACLATLLATACTTSEPSDMAATATDPETFAEVGAATHEPSLVEREPKAPLVFHAQQGWSVESPSSNMRKAQYRLPRVASDTEDASLIVYFFGGGGGSVQANLDRWGSQFEREDGTPASESMRIHTRSIASCPATLAELSGTYVAETFPGSGETHHKPDWSMRAAIIETQHGPYYVKLVGPRSTVDHWQASYERFLASVE